jgi:capsular polysaccharide biosynthesis protein
MITNEESFQDPKKFYHAHNWIIDSSELQFLPDTYLPLIRIKNLRFFAQPHPGNNPLVQSKRPDVTVKGPVFLAPANVPYYHAITDILAHFHYIQKYVPDIKMIFCANQSWKESVKGISEDISPYMANLVENYSNLVVFDTHFQNVLFEEVITFPNECLWQSDRPIPFVIQKELCQYSQIEVIDEHIKMMNHLKDSLRYGNGVTAGKKLYVTRSSKNLRKIREREQTDYYTKEKQARRYADEDILEEYFKNKGFTVVDPSGMTIWEQIELFKDAEIVAGIKGSNIFNAVWMQPNQTVIMLYTTKFWNYEFERYFEHLRNIEVKPESWAALSQDDTDTKTPVQDLISEYERLAALNGIE